VGRLSPELRLEFDTGPIPPAAHQELQELRWFGDAFTDRVGSSRVRIAEILAKSAVKLHAGGRSETALGLLEMALAKGLEHPAIPPSRQALLDKGFKADNTIAEWCRLYCQDLGSGRGRPRVRWTDLVSYRENMLRDLVQANWVHPEARAHRPGVRTVLNASDDELRAILDDKLLVMMAQLDPDRARSLSVGYKGRVTNNLLGVYLACADNQALLAALKGWSTARKFKLMAAVSQGKGLGEQGLCASDPSWFLEQARDFARQLATDPACVDRRSPLAWLAKHDSDFESWLAAHRGELPVNLLLPGEPSIGQAPMSQSEFQEEFGPRVPWFEHSEEDLVHRVNTAPRGLQEEQAPLLRGSLTSWGWFAEGEEPESDWGARAEAWRLALELHGIAEAGGLLCDVRMQRGAGSRVLYSGSSKVPYAPFAARGAGGLEGLKAVLGLRPEEPLRGTKTFIAAHLEELQVELDDTPDSAEQLAYDLFFGEDSVRLGVHEIFSSSEIDTIVEISSLMDQRLTDCRQYSFEASAGYGVSPILVVGRTASGYLAGLWSYVVRT
jgi:hypothetical protein